MQTIDQWQTHAENLLAAIVDQQRRLQIAETQLLTLQATSEQAHTQLERALNEHTRLDLLIKRADQALYRSKQAGRNRVTIWNEQR